MNRSLHSAGLAGLVISVLLFTAVRVPAQVSGCTDPLAGNYDPDATVDDGSCSYDPVTVTPLASVVLSDTLEETSGLVLWDDRLVTHNDSDDPTLYLLDTVTGSIREVIALPGVENTDWEAIAQDDMYLYVGDFGNNASGNRTDLQILRIAKSSLRDVPEIDTIAFVYDDQTDFSGTGPNETDFDCEALLAIGDSLYLFTKQWSSANSTVYTLPKIPGEHRAMPRGTLLVTGLVTGASYVPSYGFIVLTGYTSFLQPFLYLLYDFEGAELTSARQRKLNLALEFHQVEAIESNGGTQFYLTNERFSNPLTGEVPQKLHRIDLRDVMVPTSVGLTPETVEPDVILYPNPSGDRLHVKLGPGLAAAMNAAGPASGNAFTYRILDSSGRQIMDGSLRGPLTQVSTASLSPGWYTLVIGPGPLAGLNAGTGPGTFAGLNSGLNSGTNPGLNSGLNSGTNAGLNAGTNAGTGPGTVGLRDASFTFLKQ